MEKVEAIERKKKNGDARTPAQKAYDKVQEKRVSLCISFICSKVNKATFVCMFTHWHVCECV